MGSSDEPVRIDYDEILLERDLSFLIRAGNEDIWIPRSQVIDEGNNWVEIPEWLAVKKGLA